MLLGWCHNFLQLYCVECVQDHRAVHECCALLSAGFPIPERQATNNSKGKEIVETTHQRYGRNLKGGIESVKTESRTEPGSSSGQRGLGARSAVRYSDIVEGSSITCVWLPQTSISRQGVPSKRR